MTFNGKKIKGVLCDISGTLTDWDGKEATPIQGSIDALKRIKAEGIPLRLVTNDTQQTRQGIVDSLTALGFDIQLEEIFPPATAMAKLLKQENLRPHLLVNPNCVADFEGINSSDEEPNCVVLGDAVDGFSYQNLNEAFQRLISTGGNLYSLGKSRFYRVGSELHLGVGTFAAGLEFAIGKDAIVLGKPAAEYFQTAWNDIGCKPTEAIMVGDDIISDVEGAQNCGIQGVLVRTGKYRLQDENHPKISPDSKVDNLEEFVNILLSL